MPLQLGQLIHTNFDGAGCRTLSSAEVPLSVQKAFAARIVYPYWKADCPQSPGYRAVYLHQVSPTEVLFGWLYSDKAEGLGQGSVPCFICYYWVGSLKSVQLKALLTCLRIGPVALPDRESLPDSIASITIADPYRYRSARPGIAIPPAVEDQSDRVLRQKDVLQLFVAIDPTATDTSVRNSELIKKAELKQVEVKQVELKQVEQPEQSPEQPPEQPQLRQSSSPAQTGLEAYHLKSLNREQRMTQKIEQAQDRDRALSPTKAQGQLLLDPAQTDSSDSPIRQAIAEKSFELRVISALILLAIAISSFYFLHLFSTVPGGKLAPGRKLAADSEPTKAAEQVKQAEQKAKLTPTSAIAPPSSVSTSPDLALAQTLSGHTDAVWSVALSPDRQRLISGGADCTINLWDLQTGQVLSRLAGHTDVVRAIALSPDGQTVVSGSGDKTIKIWNLQTNELISTLEETSPVWSVALSPDGKTLVSGSGTGTLNFWQISSGELLYTIQGHRDRIFSVAVSPDGTTVATGSLDKTIKLWDLQTGKLLRTVSDPSAVRSVAFSPDGQTLASGSWDQTIKLWDWRTGTLRHQLVGHRDRIITVAFADDQTLVSGSADRTIKRWNVQTGELLQTIDDSSNWILAIAADSQEIVSGGKDKMIRVWK
jgi:WD40 repeat protein